MTTTHAPVLIIGYQRPENIKRIIETCVSAGIEKIYLSVDFPKSDDINSLEKYKALLSIRDFFKHASPTIEINTYTSNLGCSAHVLSACDWVFSNEDYVIILEDDCLPSLDFFIFCSFYFSIESQFENLVLASGSQFAPNTCGLDDAVFSKYALIWGWATTRKNWRKIRLGVTDSQIYGWGLRDWDEESVYWKEGSRRARAGFVDAWDTPLVNFIVQSGFFTLAPRNNLVSNVGDDYVATHTNSGSDWLRKETGTFKVSSSSKLVFDLENDDYLKREFYRIRKRHLISTRFTRLKDLLSSQERISLSEAVKKASQFQVE